MIDMKRNSIPFVRSGISFAIQIKYIYLNIDINKNACILINIIVKWKIMLHQDFALWGCVMGKKYGS